MTNELRAQEIMTKFGDVVEGIEKVPGQGYQINLIDGTAVAQANGSNSITDKGLAEAYAQLRRLVRTVHGEAAAVEKKAKKAKKDTTTSGVEIQLELGEDEEEAPAPLPAPKKATVTVTRAAPKAVAPKQAHSATKTVAPAPARPARRIV